MSGTPAYTKIKDVGAGSFGKCILVQDAEKRQFVMKTIDISKMSSKERKEAINEVKVLSKLKHPYIISFRESFIDHGHLCIVMDFAEGGDLFTRIQKQKKLGQPFPEESIRRWFTQALLALKSMHDQHILHRDIKSQNFFLSGHGRLKLGDFGIAKVLEATMAFAKTTIGTPYYLSPEICKEQPYSWASDMWALGCVLYEMCALKVPFDANNIKALVSKITEGETPKISEHFSPELRQICADLLTRDARKRPGAADILQRDIIQSEIRKMLREEQAKRKETKKAAVEESPSLLDRDSKAAAPQTPAYPAAAPAGERPRSVSMAAAGAPSGQAAVQPAGMGPRQPSTRVLQPTNPGPGSSAVASSSHSREGGTPRDRDRANRGMARHAGNIVGGGAGGGIGRSATEAALGGAGIALGGGGGGGGGGRAAGDRDGFSPAA